MWKWFTAVDKDGSGRITPVELQQALKNGNHTAFEISTVEMLIKLFDSDCSGTITFNEFQGIFKYVQDWAAIFGHVDQNKSGSIDAHELQIGLKQFGYNLSAPLVDRLVQKYGGHSVSPGTGTFPGPTAPRDLHVTLDRFMRICVVIKSLHEYVQPRIRDGWIQLNYEQTLELILNAPRY